MVSKGQGSGIDRFLNLIIINEIYKFYWISLYRGVTITHITRHCGWRQRTLITINTACSLDDSVVDNEEEKQEHSYSLNWEKYQLWSMK